MNELECLRNLIQVKRNFLEGKMKPGEPNPPELHGRVRAFQECLNLINDLELLRSELEPPTVGELPF